LAIDRRTGKIVWRREAPRQRTSQYQTNNSPASSSAVSDGVNVYVFFQDFGFLSYTAGGAERWRGSYMLAVDKNTGRVRWKTSYFAATGEKAWWVRGFSWHPKTVPVIEGDMIYVGAAESGGDSETRQQLPSFAELAEFPDDPKMQQSLPGIDLNEDGFVVAIRHGGRGDLTATNVIWTVQKSSPRWIPRQGTS
jgi:hypothetical protein